VEKQNASDFPKYYYTRHMQAGLCGYEDETILVDTDAINKLAATFKGKPVYIEHQDVKLDTLKQDAAGYVQDTFMGVDGWLWSEIMVTDDEAHEVINKGWAVSNAYVPTMWGEGGTKNNLPYDREVLAGEFTHLALVPNPRYEGAKIYTPEQYQARNTQLVNSLANSNPTEKKGNVMSKFTFFKTKREEVSNASEADSVQYVNAKGEKVEISIEEMVNALESDEKQNAVLEKKVKVNGKEISVAEALERLEKLNAKKKNEAEEEKDNESDEEEKENEDEVDEEKDNESDEEKENEDEDEKKNSHFKEMKNAHLKNSGAIRIETTMTKLNRGNSLYGSSR